MPKEIIESANFVIKTDDGNRLSFKAVGSVVGGILQAFEFLPEGRRVQLMERMAMKHQQLLDKAAQRARDAVKDDS